MARPNKNTSLVDETAAYFEQGQQMKARLEKRLAELQQETKEIESALTKFEIGPRLLKPIPHPSKTINETVSPTATITEDAPSKTKVVIQLTELRPFWDYLAPRAREIVGLRASGMKPAAIAQKLGTKNGTVSAIIYHSVATLSRARENSSKPTKPPKLPSDDEPGEPAEATRLVSSLPLKKKKHRSDETGTDSSSVGIYLREIRRYPIMTREEEHEVAVRYTSTHDEKLKAKLITSNLRLVVMIANDFKKTNRNVIDLIQEGNIGLLRALEKYDPNRGVRFPSYASWWIRAFILKYILANWRLVKLGTTQNQRKLFFNLRSEKAKLEKQGMNVDMKMLAAALGVNEEEVMEMDQRLAGSDSSFDAPVRGNETATIGETMSGFVLDQPDLMTENAQARSITKDKIRNFGTTLLGRDLKIFNERLLAEEPCTLLKLAGQFDVTRERVRQLENRLKKRLREYLSDELGDVKDCLLF